MFFDRIKLLLKDLKIQESLDYFFRGQRTFQCQRK